MRNVPTRVCKILSSAPRLDSTTLTANAHNAKTLASRGFSRLPLYFTEKTLASTKVVVVDPLPMPPLSSMGLVRFADFERGLDLEPSATGLCEPDLHVFAKLFEDRLERGLEAQAFSGREIGGDDDVLDFFVGHLVDVDLTRQPAA